MPTSPIDAVARQEATLRRILHGAAGYLGYFPRLQNAPSELIDQSILRGSVLLITRSLFWRQAFEWLVKEITAVEEQVILSGYRSALAEMPGQPQLASRIAALAKREAGERAVDLAQSIDRRTRANLRRMIGNASRSWVRSPSLETLVELRASIRPKIGLTPWQAQRVEAYVRGARKAGHGQATIAAGVKDRSLRFRTQRAKAIADRGVVEAVNTARHAARVQARADGDLPEQVMKAWRDQGDDRVRPHHHQQTIYGPILLDEIYPIMNVLHPPSEDYGCRCWDVLFVPAGLV